MPSVYVAGDLIATTALGRLPASYTSASDTLPETAAHQLAGGAWRLADLIALACADVPEVAVEGPSRDGVAADDSAIARTIALWSPHPRVSGGRDRVWRIEQMLGSQSGQGAGPLPDTPPDTDPAVLVLDDEDLGFRRDLSLWERLLATTPGAVVLQTVAPLGVGPLWDALVARHADRLTVILPVGALRARHAAISQGLSWDRTLEELDRELQDGASVQDLALARRLIVTFPGCAAAIYERGANGGLALSRFVYHPDDLEGTWEARQPGATADPVGILTATIARHLLSPGDYPLFAAAGRGLAAMRAAHEAGGGAVREGSATVALASFAPGSEQGLLQAIFHPPASTPPERMPEAAYRTAFPRSALGAATRAPAPLISDLLGDVTGPGYEYVVAAALQIVLRGANTVLDSAPKARYGAFMTVDREEIERINEIRRLMLAYRASPGDRRPLSLAVFGPPGSGKSFSIKQLAADLFGGQQATLEFNLSQFAGLADLHEAFNQVRDASVRGQVPLVFWDEFDSDNLAWLKEFLAPMQDAEFRSGGIAHPFAKVIFVFAGGTAAEFARFDRSAGDDAGAQAFRMAKGPDFVSRLRGYLNIKGPNPTGDADVAHLIRRAVLLRSVLERSQPQLVDPASRAAAISPSVARGFLRVDRFRHGARSLEAIVGMSALAGARYFGVTELPSPDLLHLHATDDFMAQVREGELEEATTERLAAAGHAAWRRDREARGWQRGERRSDTGLLHPLIVDFHELPEAAREQNRHSARVMLAKLGEIGYRVVALPPARRSAERPIEVQPGERARLVEIEHARWLRDRLLRGYAHAPATDERLRLHRDIVPFDELVEEDRELHEGLVDAHLEALAVGGYRLVPVVGATNGRVRVAVIGHRILADLGTLAAGVREALDLIRGDASRAITVVSMLAEGADRLVAEEALRLPGGTLEAILPRSPEEYAGDFGPDGSPSRLHFAALLARATAVRVVPPDDDAKYRAAGQAIVDAADVVLGMWDGRAAQGPGGTGEQVAWAQSRGKPVFVVRTGNRHPATDQPTTLGAEQGTIYVERLEPDGRVGTMPADAH
jgi:hypothetical protein